MLTPDEQALLTELQAKAVTASADDETRETRALIEAQTDAEIRLIRERAKARERELLAAAEADMMRTMSAADGLATVAEAEAEATAAVADSIVDAAELAAEDADPELVVVDPVEPDEGMHAEPDGDELVMTEADTPPAPDARPAVSHWLYRPLFRRSR